MWRIPLFDLDYDDREFNAVDQAVRSKWLTSGPRTKEFESAFAAYLGGNVQAIAIANCTAALHVSLLAAGVQRGDDVIIPALSFIASLNVVKLLGARPILADCTSYDDWNVDPADIQKKITKKTKAIVIVHFAGMPCDMSALMQIASERNIPLIEDVAHAIGATYKGRMCGTFGECGCFSFFANKNLATGEGGMITTGEKSYADILKLLRNHGMTIGSEERYRTKQVSYDIAMPGFNYRMDEIRSALGLVQLSKLNENNAKRAFLSERYRKKLAETIMHVPWENCPSYVKSSYHIFPVLLPCAADRDRFIAHMHEQGIQTSIHYPSYKTFSAYRNAFPDATPIADSISQREVTLPLYPRMNAESVDSVCEAIADYSAKEKVSL